MWGVKMKREFIEGMKCLGSIAAILLQGALESMAKAQEENGNTYREECREEDNLRKKWEDELFYYSDERINQELKKCMIYNYSVEYDGRYKCIEKIAEYNSKNNYKVC